jgi:antitoxin (DNA-binding transcriptional repressor) of toxin-antitoxin stability system
MDIHNITEAKAQLSKIVEKILTTGEDVILLRAGKPVVKMSVYQPVQKKDFIGMFEGQFKVPDDWDEWPEEEARALGIIDDAKK